MAELAIEGEKIRERNLDVLKRAFATPMDREDIYRAYVSVDVLNAFANIVSQEVDVLGIKPDKACIQMASLLRDAQTALKNGYAKLADTASEADKDAHAVSKSQHEMEKLFRKALADLFDVSGHAQNLDQKKEHAEASAMQYVAEMFKRREIYRHFADASHQMAFSGRVLHEIVAQIA